MSENYDATDEYVRALEEQLHELVDAMRAYLPFLPPEYAKASMVANPKQLVVAAAYRQAVAGYEKIRENSPPSR